MNLLRGVPDTLRFLWQHPENDGHRLKALARLLGWQLWQRVVGRPLTVGLADGIRLRCYPHSVSAAAVVYCHRPEWREMRFVLDFLKPGDVFIDVGANIGVYSLLACSIDDIVVWAFEPSSSTAQRLAENITLNSLQSRVRLRQLAIGAAVEPGRLTTGMDAVNHLVQVTDGSSSEPVEVVTLDSEIPSAEADRTSLVKIDVEGGEEAVLRGAQELLRRREAVFIVERNFPAELAALFSAMGYLPYEYDPRKKVLLPVSASGTTNQNLIFTGDVGRVAARVRTEVPGGCSS